ncbi:MAG TPA: glycosyltransferase family 4 protein [Polyangia bacterium]|nr:glycosyltransferase family 4 protein [Polyangia bacterium]
MRVVFFVQGERVPAARARGFVIARALEAEGVACDVRVPRPSVYGDTRLPWPLSLPRPLYVPLAALSRWSHLRDLRDDDVIFFQRPMTELPTTWFERLAARGRRAIFDFDDAIFERRSNRRKFPALVALADRVIAGNPYLAARAGAPGKTTIIPTAVDADRYAYQKPRDTRGKDVVVGWTGLDMNYRQLMHALPGLRRALERTGARFVAISNRPPPAELAPLRPEYVPWRPETEIEDLARIDIGLMPLPDGPIERGKCAYKLIQYMALGRPGVASPVGANRDVVTEGVDGFLPDDAAGWESAIVSLVEDPSLRRAVGERARARVEAAYSVRAVIPLYKEAISAAQRGR